MFARTQSVSTNTSGFAYLAIGLLPSLILAQALVPAPRLGICFTMFDVYLKMLSGKIITPKPFLSREIISSAPSKIRPELGQIGRASCRERVEIAVVAGAVEETERES